MPMSQKPFLLFISFIALLMACSSPYKNLQQFKGDPGCIQQFKPVFTSVQYNTTVDVMGRHISGVLVIKHMADSSTRLVFAMKTGFKFFDFAFLPDSGFRVLYIVEQMDKKAVITTLRKDFELILFRNTDPEKGTIFGDEHHRYYAFKQEKGTNYYITDTACSELIRVEKSSRHKVVVEAMMAGYSAGLPDTIGILHHNFNFRISLKKLDTHVAR